MASIRPLTIIQSLLAGADFTSSPPATGPVVANSVSIYSENNVGGLFAFNPTIYMSLERIRWDFGEATSFEILIGHLRGGETTLISSEDLDDPSGSVYFDNGRTLAPGETILVNTAGAGVLDKVFAEVVALPLAGEFGI